jgi:CarboxypepD_reg-like domain
MRLIVAFLFLIIAVFTSRGQELPLGRSVIDERTKDPLDGASVTIYRNGKTNGIITNRDGRFRIADTASIDSIKISMVGHTSRVLSFAEIKNMEAGKIALPIAATNLTEIIVRPLNALEIIEKAIKETKASLPATDFENNVFYREVIKDKEKYFSVAEAIFRTQYDIGNKSCRLQMLKGRSKEDVSYTRLFEDFHPGGGPEGLTGRYFSVEFPDFLNAAKMHLFAYKKEPPVIFDGKMFYVISFDQKPAIHEALEKGEILIDITDFTVLRYSAFNSPAGTPYIKDLAGTDKVFAELLHIDFKRKGWTRNVSFKKINDRLVLSHANAEYKIGYKQPKKDLDLDLTITTELAAATPLQPITHRISREEAWKRKNIVANLPTDFDPDYWGGNNIISATEKVDSIIKTIARNNHEDAVVAKLNNEWQYLNKNFFVAYQQKDSITIVPVMKGLWEDDETAGMIYKNISGDFSMETAVVITKRSNSMEQPDNGFQQAGFIIRNSDNEKENNLILCIGTGGNSQSKIFLRKTENGKSKGPVNKIDGMQYWLRLEKKGSTLTAWYKSFSDQEWKKIATYQLSWLNGPLQAGYMVMARFAGGGPKSKPDMKAVFSNFRFIKNN